MSTRKYELAGKMVAVLDGLLSVSEANKLRFITSEVPLARKGVTTATNHHTFHYVAENSLQVLKGAPLCHILIERIKEIFALKSVDCDRIVYREIVYGDHFEYHQDSHISGHVTAIVYLNESWDESFHGETLFKGEDGVGLSVLPKPGRVTLFDGQLHHSSTAPSRLCFEARKILVFNFQGH